MEFLDANYSGLLLAQSPWALFLLRVIVASIFLAHGVPKLRNLKQTWQNFEGMGFWPGKFWGTLIAFLEGVGGLSLLFGFFVQWIGLVLALEMIVATGWRLKNKHTFVDGYEFDVLLIVASLILATMDGGAFALGNLLPFLLR